MVALPVDNSTAAEATADTRRITEHDPALARLKARTERELRASIAQFARDLRSGAPASQAQSHFIDRHTLILRNAYTEAHREGQRDYYDGVSQTPDTWANHEPDNARMQRRMFFYAPSVAKMAHEAVMAYNAAQVTDGAQALIESADGAEETVKLYNPYPRQRGGLFGFGGPGKGAGSGGSGMHHNPASPAAAGQSRGRTAAGGGGGAKAQARGGAGGGGGGGGTTATKPASAKAAKPAASKAAAKPKAPKAAKAPKAPKAEHQKTEEELAKEAKARVSKAQREMTKANKAVAEAEKSAAELRTTNVAEITRLQNAYNAARSRESNSYTLAKEALLDERAAARVASGKAPKTAERMAAAKPPYEQAKAEAEAAKAVAAASKAKADTLFEQYRANFYPANAGNRGYDYTAFTRMQKAHPDWKAALNQQYKDEALARKADYKAYRLGNKYLSARDSLAQANKVTADMINAHPLRAGLLAETKAAEAALYHATGEDTVFAARAAHAAAQSELTMARMAQAHPTWKISLRDVATHAAVYGKTEDWSAKDLKDAQKADETMAARIRAGEVRQKVGDLALEALQHTQGFDGQPSLVDEATLNATIAAGDHELWRGDTTLEHTMDYLNGTHEAGTYHAGLGIRGNGTYTQMSASRGLETAKSYASARRNNGARAEGTVIRMALKADAKIVEYDRMLTERQRAQDAIDARISAHIAAHGEHANDAELTHMRALRWLIAGDSSHYAVAMGYDAIQVSRHGQMIILNRTALRISRQLRPHNVQE